VTLLRAQPSNLQIVGIALLLFSGVLLGVGIHHLVATGTCSSTGYSANYGPVPTCPSGTGWWFAFVFGGVIGGLIGALMARSLGLVFAGLFGAIGFGALSILLDSHAQSTTKVFGAVFGGCFAVAGVAAGAAVIVSAIGSWRRPASKPAPPRAPTSTSAFGSPQGTSAFGTASKSEDPILSAYAASAKAPAGVPGPSPMNLVSGLQAARQVAAGDLVDELAKLADLHDKGVLTDQEFANAKAKLLGHA
jgi:predicted lipid-binding transport protein (Tim44 family)